MRRPAQRLVRQGCVLTGCERRIADFVALQDTGADENASYACVVYLLERSAYRKARSSTQSSGASNKDAAGEAVTIRDIIAGTECTVFQFFKATTKMLELAAHETWLIELVPDLQAFVDEFKQVEVKFMFAYMLHEKLRKMYSEICLDAADKSGALDQRKMDMHAQIQNLIWVLFLAVRSEENLTDLVPGFFLLISSVHAVMMGRPPNFIQALAIEQRPEHRDTHAKDTMKNANDQCGDLTSRLCDAYCCTELKKVS